jgi:hypothetical protein
MPDTYQFTSRSSSLTIAFSRVDRRLFDVAVGRVSPGAGGLLRSIFLTSDKLRPRAAWRGALVEALDSVIGELMRDRNRLLYDYSHRYEFEDGKLKARSSGSGATYGIILKNNIGYFFSLDTNVGKCNLTKWGTNALGQGYMVETVDCRHLTSLATENMGEIRIGRRSVKTSLPENLRKLRGFLADQTDDEISLAYTYASPD